MTLIAISPLAIDSSLLVSHFPVASRLSLSFPFATSHSHVRCLFLFSILPCTVQRHHRRAGAVSFCPHGRAFANARKCSPHIHCRRTHPPSELFVCQLYLAILSDWFLSALPSPSPPSLYPCRLIKYWPKSAGKGKQTICITMRRQLWVLPPTDEDERYCLRQLFLLKCRPCRTTGRTAEVHPSNYEVNLSESIFGPFPCHAASSNDYPIEVFLSPSLHQIGKLPTLLKWARKCPLSPSPRRWLCPIQQSGN